MESLRPLYTESYHHEDTASFLSYLYSPYLHHLSIALAKTSTTVLNNGRGDILDLFPLVEML